MLRLISVRDGDRGAIAMIVAMLFGFGVLIGLAALTIDVGNINADRRQLQNSADAVALAFVQQCTTNATCDPTVSNSSLVNLANTNAADGFTTISRVDGGIGTPLAGKLAICGNMANATNLLACPTTWIQSMTNLQECPAAPSSGVNFVRVYTQTTMNAAGAHLLPYSFGAAITGVGSGANQQACASVTVGQPSGAAAPITLSYCEWAAATGNDPAHPGQGLFPKSPVGAWPGYVSGISTASPPVPTWPAPAAPLPALPVPGNEIIIGLQGTGTTHNCPTWNNHDGPGGFGYLNTSTGCTAAAPVNGWIQVDTGNTMPSGCSLSPYFNKVIYLPVFSCMTTSVGGAPIWRPTNGSSCTVGNGGNTWYYIDGYAKFYLSGFKTGGGPSDEANRTNPLATPSLPCTGNDRCVSGWFLKGLVNTPPAPPSPPGAPSLGAYVVQLSG
jgi:Flp pilus assembly protein TadG